MEGWSGITLNGVASTGDLTQIYPTWSPTGSVPPGTIGQSIKHPKGGRLGSIQLQTDDINGGVIEIWDINGEDGGVDVSSGTTITNTQKNTIAALGKAKLIYSQNFTSTSGAVTPASFGRGFLHGLAGRYVQTNGGATCTLNLTVEGGFDLTISVG